MQEGYAIATFRVPRNPIHVEPNPCVEKLLEFLEYVTERGTVENCGTRMRFTSGARASPAHLSSGRVRVSEVTQTSYADARWIPFR